MICLSPTKCSLDTDASRLTSQRASTRTDDGVGIIGAGQLAWMLGLAGKDLGKICPVYAQDPTDSAAMSGTPTTIGPIGDGKSLARWLKDARLRRVLIESELTPFAPLQFALEESQAELLPSLKSLGVVRNKLQQKRLFDELSIATAPWCAVPRATDQLEIRALLATLSTRFPAGIAFKWALGGYDGKGVLVLSADDLKEIDQPGFSLKGTVLEFFRTASQQQIPIYAEAMIPFQWEVALAITLGESKNEEVFYPLMLSEQLRGTCFQVKSLNTVPSLLASDIEEEARSAARQIGRHLGLQGTYALEFFVTKDLRLLVNEMAPRVHNSCHVSQLCGDSSQFHNHMRAAFDLPLKKPQFPPFYGMINILGQDGYRGAASPIKTHIEQCVNAPALKAFAKNLTFYWYDKATSSPRRKLGHINTWAENKNQLEEQLSAVSHILSEWRP